MLKNINETLLSRLQLIGMLLVPLLVAIGLGSYFTVAYINEFESNLQVVQEKNIRSQQTVLEHESHSVENYLEYLRVSTESVLKQSIKTQTDQAYSFVDALYRQQKGKMPEAALKKLILEALRPLRFFDGRGYFFVDDDKGMCLLLPTAPQLEGTSLWDNRDPTGHYIMRDLVQASGGPTRAGYSRYFWYPPNDPTRMQEKVSYVRRFEPFNWVIGTGEYLFKTEEDQQVQAMSQLRAKRFGKSGYVSILSQDGRVLVSPSRPDHEGRKVSDLDSEGRKVVQLLLDKAKGGGGVVQYRWNRINGVGKVPKMSYVSTYEPWGWVIVVGTYLDDLDEQLKEQHKSLDEGIQERIRIGALAVFITVLLSLACSWTFSSWLNTLFARYRSHLEERNNELSELARRLKLSAAVFENSNEAILITDKHNAIVSVNRSFTRITGYTPSEVIGHNPRMFASGQQDHNFYQTMWQALQSDGHWAGEIWNRRKNGSAYPEWLSISAIRSESGEINNYIAAFSDISERKLAEEQIRNLAFYDPLTLLPNRRLLLDRLRELLAACHRHHYHGAVLVIDLDNFKTLNDTRGHDVGDLLLIDVARRLRESIRDSDTVARLGGDEFVILLDQLSEQKEIAVNQVKAIGEKVLATIREPYFLDGQEHHCSSSIGIHLFHGQHHTREEILKYADTAMYQAKASGRNTLRFFEPEMQAALEARTELEAELRRALPQQQLVLYYQLQVDDQSRILGAEVLLRWQHPEHGLVSPIAFIPLAEETGLIIPIGLWVLENVCRKLKEWESDPLMSTLQIAVNVSARQFRQADFVEKIAQILVESAANPKRIKLELTESIVLDNINDTIRKMNALKEMGLAFSMDDFGTGYSSLTYIKQLPLDQLKIDQSFVRDIVSDPDDAVIVETIIAMARSLHLNVIAEGVETIEQRDFLSQRGCPSYQGYLFGRPVPVEEFEALIHTGLTIKPS